MDNILSESSDEIRHQLINDIKIMLAYAFDEGKELSAGITVQVDALWPKPAPLVQVEGALVASVAPDNTAMSILMDLHAKLSKVVAPATPVSIQMTTPSSGAWGFFWRPRLIGTMIIASIIAVVGFITTSVVQTGTATCSNGYENLNWIFAAALGAAFYTLFTAHDYVRNRTFDPTYNGVYVVRFILGVIAGFILAYVSSVYVFDTSGPNKLKPALVALLGGFSTEAVNQILQRLVDVLLAAVKGDGSSALKAKQDELKAKMEAQVADAKQNLKKGLSDVLSDPMLAAPLRDKLKAVQDQD